VLERHTGNRTWRW